ncbi:MAG: hypothetical protein A3F13_04885 [Gammaproteobacteria bacterium RIFCSPHIGHO2_12_FULL_40_19]|nr:MAG: hypothetical protein A3F13_04885 [Gammaproteobacteria bacterium RIFCSPHIGHO2_12_FULL_40_19]HLB41987.1 S24 family peptidase [Gammaproteobacteria bacterium]
MKEDFSNLSSRLRFTLKTLDISQTELAKRINVKPQVVQYLCSSQSHKSKFTCEIAEALNIDFAWLATGKGTLPNKLELSKNNHCIPLLTFEQIRAYKIYGKNEDTLEISNWVSIEERSNSNLFAVEINDRAMAPRFDLNTIIIVEPASKDIIKQNTFILVYLAEEDFIIFRQLIEVDNIKLLAAINKNLHKDILLKNEDVVLGICKEARWIL